MFAAHRSRVMPIPLSHQWTRAVLSFLKSTTELHKSMEIHVQPFLLLKTIMRLTFYQLLLIGLWVGVASAGVTNAQNLEDAQITLELRHVPLREALAQLENQVKVKFAFS